MCKVNIFENINGFNSGNIIIFAHSEQRFMVFC